MKHLVMALALMATHTPKDSTTVYICDSSNAKKYHLSENCRGLSNCQHKIVKLSLEEAKKKGKTLCGWEK